MGMRSQKVQEALRREISEIVQREIKDPRMGFTTITKVDITKDLKNAYIYYSVLGREKEAKSTRFALQSAEGYIRKLIGERLKMRYVPEIQFRIDDSMENARKVQDILDKIKDERETDEQE